MARNKRDIMAIEMNNHYHSCTRYANQTVRFSGTDTYELFEIHCKDPAKRELLQINGWLDEPWVTYTYNEHGFRDEPFDDRSCGLAFGCSFTEGTGLHQHQTWPSVLSLLTGTKIWNLGIGASASDTVFRLVDHYLSKFSPQFVCVLVPPPVRFEICGANDRWKIYSATYPPNARHPETVKEWFTYKNNEVVTQRKNLLAIQQLCNQAGVPLFLEYPWKFHENQFPYIDDNDPESKFLDFSKTVSMARDLSHPGPERMEFMANLFYQQLVSANLKLNT
jgi:hypothetical protein